MIDILIRNSVFIAHCLTKEGAAGNTFSTGKDIFQRIDEAITIPFELCCSTIAKGDFNIENEKINFTGAVGIILKPGLITFAHYRDGATSVEEYGKRIYPEGWQPPAKEKDVEDAIQQRHEKSYNELLLKDYTSIGIFMYHDDPAFLYTNITSDELFHDKTKHHNLPYYFLTRGILYPCGYDSKSKAFINNGAGEMTVSKLYS